MAQGPIRANSRAAVIYLCFVFSLTILFTVGVEVRVHWVHTLYIGGTVLIVGLAFLLGFKGPLAVVREGAPVENGAWADEQAAKKNESGGK